MDAIEFTPIIRAMHFRKIFTRQSRIHYKLLSLVEYDAGTAVCTARRRRRRRYQRNEIHLSTFESPDKHSCNP